MKIVLRKLEETPEELVPGDEVGEIVFAGDGGIQFFLPDEELARRLGKVFTTPAQVPVGDPSGRLSITCEKTVSPGTPEFYTHILDLLEGKDFRLTGSITE